MQSVAGDNSLPPYDEKGKLWSQVGGAPIQIHPFTPPKFEVGDPAAAQYLEENGYVVFKNAATPDELAIGERIFWENTERSYRGVEEGKPETWTNQQWKCLAATKTGVVSNDASAHSAFMWHVRSLPKIKQAFADVWSDDDLLVSFDGFGAYRPPELYGQTRSGWFHVDQNGKYKPGRHCVQGLLNMYESGEEDGGLVVVPHSHKQFDPWFQNGTLAPKNNKDFIMLSNHPMQELWGKENHPVKLCLSPGDFAMWDSRTSHCSHSALSNAKHPNRLRRLVAYVCMTPCSKAADLKDLRQKRIEAFKEGTTLNHWPHEFNPHPTDHHANSFKYRPVPLSDYQKQLIVGMSGKFE